MPRRRTRSETGSASGGSDGRRFAPCFGDWPWQASIQYPRPSRRQLQCEMESFIIEGVALHALCRLPDRLVYAAPALQRIRDRRLEIGAAVRMEASRHW